MTTPRDTLSALVAVSGLSVVEFAGTVLGRDERTLRRWLAGDVIPKSVAEWLARVDVSATRNQVTVRVRR